MNILQNKNTIETKVYGDDFSKDQISAWFSEESHAYSDQYASVEEFNKKGYEYHELNKLLGYSKIKDGEAFENVLSYGGGHGLELEPIIDRSQNIHIIEPSITLRNETLKGKKINYSEPSIYGKIDFPDCTFDLITCFGVLMYIPNVSFVLSEFHRVLKKGGYLLIREPISDMGMGRKRAGCGKYTRGIPLDFFKTKIRELNFTESHVTPCTFPPFVRLLKIPGISVFSHRGLTRIDLALSRLFLFNNSYYRKGVLQKLAPGAAYLFLKK